MKKLICGLIIFSLTFEMFSQITQLPEVVITAVNYKYLNAVDNQEVDISVQMLEEQVAMYDLKKSDLYDDEYDVYRVSFFIPEGTILAAYDKDGKVMRTIERFKNVKLPKSVSSAILQRFPNWKMVEDSYKVDYFGSSGNTKKQYKVKIQNGDEKLVVKLDEEGKFL